MAVAWKLEFSEDALSVSNASAARVDISDLVKAGSLSWKAGVEKLGDPPRAGEMSFTLLGRDFEPLYEDSPYYPNVRRKRRFFLSVDTGSGFVDQFVGYARTYQPVYPGNVTTQEVEVVCGDGFDILSDERVPALDPPDAQSYADVVNADRPWGYWRLGDPAGTQAVAQVRTVKRGRGKNRRRVRIRSVRQDIITEAAGVSGSAGVYQGDTDVHLGEPGMVVGDPDTAARFTSASDIGRMRVDLTGVQNLSQTQQLTIEAIVKVASVGSGDIVATGPETSGGFPVWILAIGDSEGDVSMWVHDAGGAYSIASTAGPGAGIIDDNTRHHLIAVYDRRVVKFYVDDVEYAGAWEGYTPVPLDAPAANTFLYVGADPSAPAGSNDLTVDEFAVYEYALPAARRTAHYQAALNRGYPEESAGERILAAATHGLWSETGIAASAFLVQPTMQVGQAPIAVIEEAMEAEGLQTIFGFDGSGDPFYRGWEWKADSPYNEVQATFGAPAEGSEIEFGEERLRFDDEIYNEATLARDGGTAQTVLDSQSQTDNGIAVAEPITGLANADDADVAKLGAELLALYAEPTWALDELDLHSSDDDQAEQIFALGLGSLIRYKRRAVDENTGDVGDAIDVVTHVLGYEKRLEAGDVVSCTFKLARGFNAAPGHWRLGIEGFSELGETTVLG
jgi:hypothetical protein